MKKKYLSLVMALIMCFSFAVGSFAATGGTQITPDEMVVPTTQGTIDKVIDSVVDSELGEQLGGAGEDINNGIKEGTGFLQRIYDLIETVKIALANVLNTLFKKLGVGTSDSLFG